MKTNKIQFIGTVDGQMLDVTLEFARMDKAMVLKAIRACSCANPATPLTFTDIHGNILNINFNRSKVVQLSVIEIFDALNM